MFSPSSTLKFLPLFSLLFPNVLSANTPQPYTINVDPGFIEQTRKKVSDFRPSLEISGPEWADGPPLSKLNEFAEYWANSYDWWAVQSRINSESSQFKITLPPPGGKYNLSVELYFRHERSNRTDAIPLLMLHGWPSTSDEWAKVIPGLVNPADDSPAFHVVAPDLPGFGFSPAPKTAGMGTAEHSALFAGLMAELGYKTFALYSTDMGFFIAQEMVVTFETRIVNHLTDFYIVPPNNTDVARFTANQTTPEESAFMMSMNAFTNNHAAYSALHSTLPLSVGYAFNDSPLGFFAWMYQTYHTLNDNLYNATASEVITQALLLYIPGVYGNIRSYKEMYNLSYFVPREKSTVPTSVLQFGVRGGYTALESTNFVPRDWVERNANVTFFARHEGGGHFPAVNMPELVVKDIRASFASLGY